MIKYSSAFMELGLLRPCVHKGKMYFSTDPILHPFLAVTRNIPRYQERQPSRVEATLSQNNLPRQVSQAASFHYYPLQT